MGIILFVGIPLLELFLLGWVSDSIGFLPTVALVVLTGIGGSKLTRLQGRKTLARVQEQMRRGIMPTHEMVEGVLILIAGALLITPGVLTDGVGFLLLVPSVRSLVLPAAQNWFRGKIHIKKSTFSGPFENGNSQNRTSGSSVEVDQEESVELDPFRKKRQDPVVEVDLHN